MSRECCRNTMLLLCLAILAILGSTPSWAKAKSKPLHVGPKTWVVYIQRLDAGGQSGMWPESTSTDGVKSNAPWLHRGNGDKIKFVITSGAPSCQLVFDDGSPLVPLGSPNTPADTITVYPVTSANNGLYVVSPKLKLDKGTYCSYWFHIVGNPSCVTRSHVCLQGTPPPSSLQEPCWANEKKEQIGPGMDTSD